MSSNLAILVVANYPADRQQSMMRFARLLVSFYQPYADVYLVRPPVIFGSLSCISSGILKYLAYIDKLLLFPLWLVIMSRFYRLVHIADHSNAFYSFCCPSNRCVVTCHDLLAVRGAMGDQTVACRPSPIGIFLQRLILAGLARPGAVVFDSQSSFNDFQCLVEAPSGQRHAVIPIPLNAPFTSDPASLQLTLQEQRQIPSAPFLLMVGSALPRKNRPLALRLLLELGEASPYRLVFAGAPLSPTDQAFIADHQLTSRVHMIELPSHALLNHLYCDAHALLFPSLAEGFGWPLIEAQACGCPVIASTITSIPEVAAGAALYAEPHDVATFAVHVRALEDPAKRANMISQGYLNLNRFDPEVISRAYANFALHPDARAL
jgi:glycosyltransferase involved in cell wall biosynthesis